MGGENSSWFRQATESNYSPPGLQSGGCDFLKGQS
jgi:hypothetical protein